MANRRPSLRPPQVHEAAAAALTRLVHCHAALNPTPFVASHSVAILLKGLEALPEALAPAEAPAPEAAGRAAGVAVRAVGALTALVCALQGAAHQVWPFQGTPPLIFDSVTIP